MITNADTTVGVTHPQLRSKTTRLRTSVKKSVNKCGTRESVLPLMRGTSFLALMKTNATVLSGMERLANTAIQAILSHDVNGLLTTAEKNLMQGNSTLAVGLNLYHGAGKT